jgi:hypothetical protein
VVDVREWGEGRKKCRVAEEGHNEESSEAQQE